MLLLQLLLPVVFSPGVAARKVSDWPALGWAVDKVLEGQVIPAPPPNPPPPIGGGLGTP